MHPVILTPRERQVHNLLRYGKPNKNIAHALGISESTVKVHLRNMMRKMNVTNRVQVAFFEETPPVYYEEQQSA